MVLISNLKRTKQNRPLFSLISQYTPAKVFKAIVLEGVAIILKINHSQLVKQILAKFCMLETYKTHLSITR